MNQKFLRSILVGVAASYIATSYAAADSVAIDVPFYKPSSRSPAALDISLNEYGAHDIAPDAYGIGDIAPDFDLAKADGGTFSLTEATEGGPVVLIFYRGHW